MEHLSFTYIASQSVGYLGQTHNWSDTDIISSYKEICKQLAICQEKLREEREQRGQKKLRKSTSYLKQLSQKAAQQSQQSQREGNNNVFTPGDISNQLSEKSAIHAEEKHLIRIKNALWRRMSVSKESKPVSLKSLECSFLYQRKDIHSEQQKNRLTDVTQTHSSSYVPRYNRSLQNRRIHRKIRIYRNTINPYTLNYLRRLPRQTINNNPFANQIFNGINFR